MKTFYQILRDDLELLQVIADRYPYVEKQNLKEIKMFSLEMDDQIVELELDDCLG